MLINKQTLSRSFLWSPWRCINDTEKGNFLSQYIKEKHFWRLSMTFSFYQLTHTQSQISIIREFGRLLGSSLFGSLQLCEQWGRRLEGWPNTADRLAGWRSVTQPAGCDFVRDGRSMPPALTDNTTCPGLGGLIYYWMYTKYRHELYVMQGRHGLVL